MSTRDAETKLARDREASFDHFVTAFLLLSIAARLVSIFLTGFCDDEAYVITIQRTLALSYFDHPPLHQWILPASCGCSARAISTACPFWRSIF